MSTETPENQEAEAKTEAKKPRRPVSRPRPSRAKNATSPGQSQDAVNPTVEPDRDTAVAATEAQAEINPADEPAKKPARKRSSGKKKARTTALPTGAESEATAKAESESVVENESGQSPVKPLIDAEGAEINPASPADEPPKKSGRKRKRGPRKKKSGLTHPLSEAGAESGAKSEVENESSAENENGPRPSKPLINAERAEVDPVRPAEEPPKKSGRKRKRSSGKKKAGLLSPKPEAETETEDEIETSAGEDTGPRSTKLLINAEEPEECRVALLENGKLESFHVETISREQLKGNIYKGRIVSIETNLQAAFVDIGTGKNGFLPFNEIHPEYYKKEVPPDSHWKGHKIKEVLAEGQEVMVEVVKDVTGNKGASLTTFLSLPGRYVVLMPGSDSHGISKKIDKEEERQKLREMLAACNIPEGVGYIIRTASDGITKSALTNDVKYQIKLWSEIKAKGQSEPTPALLYKEQSIIDRFLRDHFSAEIEEILVDSQEAYDQVANFLALLPAAQRKKTTVRLHKGPRPLLNSYNIEEQIEQIFRPTVKLPSGGSIVINPTEALVSIDVNSGSTGRDKNFEDTIFLANMEAAEELARQLRLRDLGGLIVVDFIDMRPMSHIKEVEKKVKTSMKRDKAKVDFTRISKFGLMEISRQRMGAPIQTGNYQPCEYCQGHGMVRSVETQALTFLRQIQTGVTRKNVATVRCHLPMEVGQYLLNKKRADLVEMERDYKVSIVIETDATLKPAEAKIEFLKM
jgi:ribonuclease E